MTRKGLWTLVSVLAVMLSAGQGCPTGGPGWPPSSDDNNGGSTTSQNGEESATSENGGGSTTGNCDNGVGYGASIERIGVLRSVDGGATWTKLGHACLHAAGMIPVDPAPRLENGRVVLYFFDMASVMHGPDGQPHVMYRAVSITEDHIEFSAPTPAYSTTQYTITDPDVAVLPDGTYRMFVSDGSRVPSASGSDGVTFTADDGFRSEVGGVPGALVLPDGRVRLFVCGSGGIVSLISDDGLEFESEPGTRISAQPGEMVCDPDPIRLLDGTYMMVYKVHPDSAMGPNSDQIYLATSDDGLNWTTTASPLATGSVPGLVQLEDGTLLIYYVDFSAG